MALRIAEIGSDEFNVLQMRLRSRSEFADVPLTGARDQLMENVHKSQDQQLIDWCEAFYKDLPETAQAVVDRVIERVKTEGDSAVCNITRLADNYPLTQNRIAVSKLELMQKAAEATEADEAVLELCKSHVLPRLRAFHDRQKLASWQIEEQGGSVGVRMQPLNRVALYVPGGKAFYASSLMMTVVPAQVAGVAEIAVFTPPGGIEQSPLMAGLLLALGITEVYRVGGAQAVAAAALGTEKIAKCDKIVGPGNLFVALAKKALFGRVGIDSIAGPSEVVILFDQSADPRFVAADLLAQAEHDAQAAAVGVTDNEDAAKAVAAEVEKQLATLPRREIAEQSLENYGGIVKAPSLGFAVRFVDSLAPEHCEVMTADAEKHASQLKHAGAIFVGPWAPEAFGDYCAGPNHVLPTAGSARFASALSVHDFTRQVSIIRGSKELLAASREAISKLAAAEGLDAHARSVDIRFA